MSEQKKRGAAAPKRQRMVYICIPITGKDYEAQRKRAEELADRIREKGWLPVNPFDLAEQLNKDFAKKGIGVPNYYDYMSLDFRELMQCDGMLLAEGVKQSYGCSIELAVGQAMAASRKKMFSIYHTKEEWADVKSKYII